MKEKHARGSNQPVGYPYLGRLLLVGKDGGGELSDSLLSDETMGRSDRCTCGVTDLWGAVFGVLKKNSYFASTLLGTPLRLWATSP